MRALQLAFFVALAATPALAQTAAPSAGSGGGGGVADSVSRPREPVGKTPPGTSATPAVRDAAGTAVIGKTTASGTGAPGATDGKDSGVTK